MNKPPLKVNMISETTFTVRGHGVHTAFIEMTKGVSARPELDVVVNKFRKADVTHIQTIGLYSALHLLSPRGGKKVVSVHVIPDSLIGSIKGAEKFAGLSKAYLKWFYGKADMLLPVSEETQKALKGDMKLKNPSQVLFNTVNSVEYITTSYEKEAARKKLGIRPGQFVVMGNGQVQPRKRFDTFVAVAKQLPDVTFIWVGGIPFKRLGADYEHMQALIHNAPSNVTVTGVIELEEVHNYLKASDAFMLPSDQENHPLAMLEAAAAQLPIVVRDIPQYDSAFGNDVLRGNDTSFVNIIKKLATDKAYYAEAVKGSKLVAKRFDTPNAAKQLLEIYTNLVRGSE
jgi:1,2-diacylglycerol-3-alpha-glucose alpha-1,2-galactosyltransferase